MNFNFKRFLKIINPQLEIGGLEVSDSSVRFILLQGKKIQSASVDLPPGIIENGKVNDPNQFISSLNLLKGKIIGNKNKKIYIILSISDGTVYTETFSIPRAATSNLEEAAKLNLQMISPVDFNTAYSDWELFGGKIEKGSSQVGILGAFVAKQIIDNIRESAEKAGFEVVAVEFSGFGLARALLTEGEGPEKMQNSLFLKIGAEGLSFILIKNGYFYFLHSVIWSNFYGDQKQISLESLKKIIVEEIKKVLSFYETHSGGSLNTIFLVGPALTEKITKMIAENFSDIKIIIPALKKFQNLSPTWFSVLGSALRGAIPRSKDKFISLAAVGTEEKFENQRTLLFFRMWRNVVAGIIIGIFVIFLGLDLFLRQEINKAEKNLGIFYLNPEVYKMNEFQNEAAAFNQKVEILYAAASEKSSFPGFYKNIKELTGSNIQINKIYIQSPTLPVLLNGSATNEEAIVAFKDSLEQSPYFSNVNFQLSNIKPIGTGSWSFSLSFNIKK